MYKMIKIIGIALMVISFNINAQENISFTKKIVERHNGSIKVRSKLGEGTRFDIVLKDL